MSAAAAGPLGESLIAGAVPPAGGGGANAGLLASLEAAAVAQAALRAKNRRARVQLLCAMGFCFLFMIAEVVGGFFANSLAIMTECVSEQAEWHRVWWTQCSMARRAS